MCVFIHILYTYKAPTYLMYMCLWYENINRLLEEFSQIIRRITYTSRSLEPLKCHICVTLCHLLPYTGVLKKCLLYHFFVFMNFSQ